MCGITHRSSCNTSAWFYLFSFLSPPVPSTKTTFDGKRWLSVVCEPCLFILKSVPTPVVPFVFLISSAMSSDVLPHFCTSLSLHSSSFVVSWCFSASFWLFNALQCEGMRFRVLRVNKIALNFLSLFFLFLSFVSVRFFSLFLFFLFFFTHRQPPDLLLLPPLPPPPPPSSFCAFIHVVK